MQSPEPPLKIPVWARILLNSGLALTLLFVIFVVGYGSYICSRAWQRMFDIKNSDVLMLLAGLPLALCGGILAGILASLTIRCVLALLTYFYPDTNWKQHPGMKDWMCFM
ncbi:MAG: hypothetical protein ACKO85_07265 [Isosphaeraceae bacterium]